MDKKEMFTVAYSPNQDAFHIETLEETLNRERVNCMCNRHDEYFIIDVTPDEETASKMVDVFEESGKYKKRK